MAEEMFVVWILTEKGCVLGKTNVDERRQFQRFYHAYPVQLQFKDPSQFGGCLSRDISEGGIRVRMNDFVPLDAELSLQIQLTDERVVECVGRVAWVEKNRFGDHYQVGLKFDESESILEPRKKIQQYLQSHET